MRLDEIPVVLHELNDSALNYIAREQYDKSLILLQKAQAIYDQMNVQNENPFDRLLNLTLLHNMALCYQKVGALEECALYIEACILNMKLCL